MSTSKPKDIKDQPQGGVPARKLRPNLRIVRNELRVRIGGFCPVEAQQHKPCLRYTIRRRRCITLEHGSDEFLGRSAIIKPVLLGQVLGSVRKSDVDDAASVRVLRIPNSRSQVLH